MAGLGRKVWSAGDVLAAADVNGYLMDQAVMVFDDAAARGSAIGTATEGMVTYLKDTNALEKFDGSSFIAVAQDLTTGTEGFTALSAGTAGISFQPVSHNYVINGGFDIWQRGTAAVTTNVYGPDRHRLNLSGATGELTQGVFTPAELEVIGFGDATFYASLTTTVADDNSGLLQRVEDVRTLAGQAVTLSFFAKADTTRTIAAFMQQSFGSGGSSIVETTPENFTVTTSWQRFVHTVTIGGMSGKTIGPGSFLSTVISNPNNETFTLDLWGVQLEAGSVATPFKRHAPSLQGELAACQRYYQKIEGDAFGSSYAFGNIATTTSARVFLPLATTLRATPTMIVSGTQTITSNGTSLTPSSYTNLLVQANGLKVHAAVTGAVGSHACSWNIASGVIELSSEL